jgi:hypothetical protein
MLERSDQVGGPPVGEFLEGKSQKCPQVAYCFIEKRKKTHTE